MLFAAETAQSGGWAHLIGLVVAALIAFLGIGTHQWRLSLQDPSPTPPEDDEIDVTPGDTYDPDTDDTDDEPAPDTGWWGRRIRLPDGSVVVRQPHALDVVDEDKRDDEPETREEMADRLVAGGGSYADWVREIMNAFDVSEATAKRAIRDARDRAGV